MYHSTILMVHTYKASTCTLHTSTLVLWKKIVYINYWCGNNYAYTELGMYKYTDSVHVHTHGIKTEQCTCRNVCTCQYRKSIYIVRVTTVSSQNLMKVWWHSKCTYMQYTFCTCTYCVHTPSVAIKAALISSSHMYIMYYTTCVL